jgi:hypothetical protein
LTIMPTRRPPLHHGPYHSPALRRGDRTTCLFRDAEVVITGWSNGRIAWPRCRALHHRGGSGLLVDAELARAVRVESATAVMYWWGVSCRAVWHWRRALGVTKANNPTTHALYLEAAERGGAASRRRGVTEVERRHRRRLAKKNNLIRFARAKRSASPPWTAKELAQLGKLPDEALAQRTGRTVEAVRIMRNRRGIPKTEDGRRKK